MSPIIYIVNAKISAPSSPAVLSAWLALESLRVGTFWKSTLLSALSHQVLSPSSADTWEAARAKSVMVWNRPANLCHRLIKGYTGLLSWNIHQYFENRETVRHYSGIAAEVLDWLVGVLTRKVLRTLEVKPASCAKERTLKHSWCVMSGWLVSYYWWN